MGLDTGWVWDYRCNTYCTQSELEVDNMHIGKCKVALLGFMSYTAFPRVTNAPSVELHSLFPPFTDPAHSGCNCICIVYAYTTHINKWFIAAITAVATITQHSFSTSYRIS